MKAETSFQKRIKRHVIAKDHEFFISTTPGFESVLEKEASVVLKPLKILSKEKGGISFIGKIQDCYKANLKLRTANRILMRIGNFKATNFRQMEMILSEFPWELYLPGTAVDIHVSVKKCRLFHKDAIAERITKSINLRSVSFQELSNKGTSFNQKQSLFVRGIEDHFTISLNSSGELLFKRGKKSMSGLAPIRETIAAAILKISGYKGKTILLDPMCGSGTFSLEGAMIASNIPSGWFRDFAFFSWPCFSPGMWKHMRRKAGEKIKPCPAGQKIIFSSDLDEKSIRQLSTTLDQWELSSMVEISIRDFFTIMPLDLGTKTKPYGLIVINPPYGLRLGNKDQSSELFDKICKKLASHFRGWDLALISPNKMVIRKVPFKMNQQRFFHGGLELILLHGRIPL